MPLIPKQQAPYYTGAQTTKSYIALLPQTATNPPIAIEFVNTIQVDPWTRTGTGRYEATTNTDYNQNKIWVGGQSQTPGDAADYTGVFDSSGTFMGSYLLQFFDNSGKIKITLDINDDTGTPADLSDMFAGTFNLPEIKVFN